jgi:hypothetical protein
MYNTKELRSMNRSDWMPGTRDEQLAMAKHWGLILPAKKTDWNIPDAELAALADLSAGADTALSTAKNEATRTPVATARCREAFKTLEGKMRELKKRYFFVPPLMDSDLVSLGLSPHDTHPTPTGVPTAQVTVETYLAVQIENDRKKGKWGPMVQALIP